MTPRTQVVPMEPLRVFELLTTQWSALWTGPAGRDAAPLWAGGDARLTGFATPVAVPEAKEHASSAAANKIMAALIEQGDDLSIRTALPALPPLAGRHLRRGCARGYVGQCPAWANRSELVAELTAELCVWLRHRAGRPITWPAERADDAPGAFIARTVAASRARTAPLAVLNPDRHDSYAPIDGLASCARLLIDAHQDGTIDTLTAQMLYGAAVRGDNVAEVAARAGVTPGHPAETTTPPRTQPQRHLDRRSLGPQRVVVIVIVRA